MSSKVDFLIGFIVGGLIGAGLGLLFAPQSGEETREMLKDKFLELKEKAEKVPEAIKKETQQFIQKGKEALDEKKVEL
ncbi:MAG: YtxH domain-containing protein [Coprothermobacterota bacterium]|nr:YtxH domain-containing protein [Caldisericota bacterium]MDI6868032.1 YtxH domain-containing protein [Coprothermobacterota bacterium]